MASVRMVQQTDDIKYISSNITQTLAVPGLEAGMRHAYVSYFPRITPNSRHVMF